MGSTLVKIHGSHLAKWTDMKWGQGMGIYHFEEVHFNVCFRRTNGNATTMKASMMKVIAIGYRYTSRLSILSKGSTTGMLKRV